MDKADTDTDTDTDSQICWQTQMQIQIHLQIQIRIQIACWARDTHFRITPTRQMNLPFQMSICVKHKSPSESSPYLYPYLCPSIYPSIYLSMEYRIRGPSRSLVGNCILSGGSATGQRSRIEKSAHFTPSKAKLKSSLMMPNMVGLPALHKYGKKYSRPDRRNCVDVLPIWGHVFFPSSWPFHTYVIGGRGGGQWEGECQSLAVLHSTVAEVFPAFPARVAESRRLTILYILRKNSYQSSQ